MRLGVRLAPEVGQQRPQGCVSLRPADHGDGAGPIDPQLRPSGGGQRAGADLPAGRRPDPRRARLG